MMKSTCICILIVIVSMGASAEGDMKTDGKEIEELKEEIMNLKIGFEALEMLYLDMRNTLVDLTQAVNMNDQQKRSGLQYFGARGKKAGLQFFGARGKKALQFLGARGKKYDVAEDRTLDQQKKSLAFYGARG